jgi:hypothetical protein
MWTLFSYTVTTETKAGGPGFAPAATEATTRDLKAHPFVILALPILVAATAPAINWMANAHVEGRKLDNAIVLECAKLRINPPAATATPPGVEAARRAICPEIAQR